jgi:hypothetical protein
MQNAIVVGAAALVATAASASAAPAPRPSLQFASVTPVVLRGAHFQPTERVSLRVFANGTQAARVIRTNAGGGFVVRFTNLSHLDPCTDSVVARATGARGDKAAATVGQRACPPAP